MCQKTVLLTAAFLQALSCLAQSSPDSLSVKDLELQPAEVKALRATSNSPFANSNLNAAAIARLNLGQDLPFLLQYTPSALVTSDAGTGVGYTGIRVRGTDGTRINVTLNGIPVNDAESGGTFFVNFPDLASSTSSVQIQRGVGTSTNGPGAFGATLSMSNLENRTEAGGEAILGAGSFNTQRYTLKAGTGLLKGGWQFDVRMSKISSDGFIDRSASDLKALQLLTTWHVNEKTNLKFMVMTGREKTGQAWNGVTQDSLKTNRRFNELGLKSDGKYYDNQTDNYGQDYYQLFFNHQFNTRWSTSIAGFLTRGKGYYEEYKMGESFSSYGLSPYISPSGADTISETDMIRQLWLDNYFYGSTFAFHYDGGKTKATLGGVLSKYDGRHYGYIKWAQLGVPDDYRWYNLTAYKTDATAYFKAEHSIGKLQLFGDLQWRSVQYDLNGFRKNPTLTHDVSYNFFNPKAGINYHLVERPAEKQRIYASIALASKEPNRDDFEAASNALPKPEKLTDIELGYEWRKQTFQFSANAYYMHYTDQLVLTGKVNDVGAYTRTNVPESYRAGIELVGSVKPVWWLTLGGNATFSQNKIKDFTEYVDNYDDGTQDAINHGTTDIAFSPGQIYTGNVIIAPLRSQWHQQKLELELLNKYAGRQYLDNTSNDNRVITAYNVVDLRFRYSLQVGPFKFLGINLGINNLLDRQYESNGYTFSYIYGQQFTTANYYYPQAGRNYLASLQVQF